MNPETCQAKKEGNIEAYILKKNITYIADPPSYVEKLNRSISLKSVKTFEMPYYSYRKGESMKVYKLFKITPAKNAEVKKNEIRPPHPLEILV